MESSPTRAPEPQASLMQRAIRFCLDNKVVVFLLMIFIMAWGIMTAPFDWDVAGLPRDPVPVDAIPDIGENQQIVFTEWMGRSPRDVEDQITYPLTVALLGIPDVRTVRSFSMLGFSTIYLIFDESAEYYWSRTRVLEKLSSLSPGTLPDGVRPVLGPDATALGQVYWYYLEGQNEAGEVVGGWDLQELRSIQDWYVRYGLLTAEGISEVASIGGYVKEYQIDVDPDAMRAFNVKIEDVIAAVRMANIDVGARTIEVNKMEYVIRGVGFIADLDDIRNSVIKVNEHVPVYVSNVARVALGPALRRGALDREGAEVVGGVAVVRFGENPLAAIKNLKAKIAEIEPGLPRKTLADGTVSQVRIVPFYDRTGLIYETLGTLNTALTEEIMVTIIVVLMMVLHFRSSILISGLLPLAVLMCFIAMRYAGVDANIVALSGIAIAIGTMVDMGIVVCENILNHLDEAPPGESRLEVVYRATAEVAGAVLTAITTTVVSFLPVFAMQAAEGKLFRPLAFTKTFALLASVIVALTIIPPLAHILFTRRAASNRSRPWVYLSLLAVGIAVMFITFWWAGALIAGIAAYHLVRPRIPERIRRHDSRLAIYLAAAAVAIVLAVHWLPLGPGKSIVQNVVFVSVLIGGALGFFILFLKFYRAILSWCLDHKLLFLSIPLFILILGLLSWQGFAAFFGWLPNSIKEFGPVSHVANQFPGLSQEFMPPLDEGSFLYMPTTMPHASIGEVLDVLQKQDIAFAAIPEVRQAVGKLGRAETPLDSAPISMIETIIDYYSEYLSDEAGHRLLFRFEPNDSDVVRNARGEPVIAPDGEPYQARGRYVRDEQGQLIPDPAGRPFRQWRPPLDPDLNSGRAAWAGIRSPDDIWDEILRQGEIPGTTSAPKLQPIATRIVMLQSGMRAPMGVKVRGPDLDTIERVGLEIEQRLREVPSIAPASVFAERIVGKPYLEIRIDRQAIARYGIMLGQVQEVIEVAIGGKRITSTVEGRERYPVRIRYQRELRDTFEALSRILVASPMGEQIPLGQLAVIEYERGPQVIKSEDTFLTGYVLFDMRPGYGEVDVVRQARAYLEEKRQSGEFEVPPGVSYTFAGSYENQVRASKRLMIVVPLSLFIIFMVLYLQFRRVSTTGLVFSGIAIAWAGGFLMIWLYAQPWFLNFSVFGTNMRDLFQIHTINLSVAIWVGFLALFGIATDDGVVMATYLDSSFAARTPRTVREVRQAVLAAGLRRVRPCLMTTATTLLALLPVLTSTGRGSDIMVPMAIPSFGGMTIAVVTMLVVPVLYSAIRERAARRNGEPGSTG